MDIQQTLLLPSQESLVQRLEHIASYSEQLVLVSGVRGSGKTTLVTALASELDNYNSALVICPMHAESAEIRRKILIQLISSPIFDDALPLADTLLRIQSSLTKPLHIIIDDAQYMPRELWAECLVLTQLKCAGKPISITFTIEPDSLTELNLELTESMQSLLLNVEVEPLSLAEREGLYRTLLIRSHKTPFIPREIIQAQIEKQLGTPAEVLDLLKKALEDKPEEIKSWPKYLHWLVSLFVFMAMAGIGIAIYLTQNDQQAENEPKIVFAEYQLPTSRAQWFIHHYGLSLISAAIKIHPEEIPSKQGFNLVGDKVIESMLPINPSLDDEGSEPVDKMGLSSQEDSASNNMHLSMSDADVDSNVNHDVQVADVDEDITIVERDKLEVSSIDVAVQQDSALLTDRAGYTLQIASVRDDKSLEAIVSKLSQIQQNELQLVQANFKQRHIVLFGQFDSVIEAQKQSDNLQQDLGLSAPWIRKWSDLKGYEIKSN